jgi:TRAP-type transport system small permease protein
VLRRQRLQSIGESIERGLSLLTGTALFAMMILTFLDVIGRKFFVSIPGALELSEMLMVILLFSGLPLVAWHAEHVCFELVDAMYKGRASEWSKRLMDWTCALSFAALSLATWGMARRTMAEGEFSSRLHIPIGLFVFLMALLLALAAVMHTLRALGIQPVKTPRPSDLQ